MIAVQAHWLMTAAGAAQAGAVVVVVFPAGWAFVVRL